MKQMVNFKNLHEYKNTLHNLNRINKKNKKFKAICKNIPENERIILFIAIGNYKENFSYALSLRKNVDDVFIVK